MTVQIVLIEFSVFLLVCAQKVLIASPCWAAKQAMESQWRWVVAVVVGRAGTRGGSAPSVASSPTPLPRNIV